MTLAELIAALETQRRARSSRKARIPPFEPIIGADEITLPIFVGAILTAGRPYACDGDTAVEAVADRPGETGRFAAVELTVRVRASRRDGPRAAPPRGSWPVCPEPAPGPPGPPPGAML